MGFWLTLSISRAKQVPGVSKNCGRLINNRTKAFYLIFKISIVLNKAYPILGFKIIIVKIQLKLSEIYYFGIEETKFYKPNSGDF